jgi:hypothetical protein
MTGLLSPRSACRCRPPLLPADRLPRHALMTSPQTPSPHQRIAPHLKPSPNLFVSQSLACPVSSWPITPPMHAQIMLASRSSSTFSVASQQLAEKGQFLSSASIDRNASLLTPSTLGSITILGCLLLGRFQNLQRVSLALTQKNQACLERT